MLNTMSSDNKILKEAKKTLRKNMFQQCGKNNDLLCQESVVSSDLIKFINIVLHGPESEMERNF